LVQYQPDQSTLSMGNGSDGLIVSQARHRAAIHDLEDTSLVPGCGIRSLEEASRVTVIADDMWAKLLWVMETTAKKQLTISSSMEASSVVIRFEDTGVGIPSPNGLSWGRD
jgi:hypothetical protein